MKTIIKKILYFVPLFVGGGLFYLLVTNQLTSTIDEVLVKLHLAKPSEESNKELILESDKLDIPQGKIVLKDYFDEWECEPKVKEYDPDNKSKVCDAYGTTKLEWDYLGTLYDELADRNRSNPLSSEYKSELLENVITIANPDNIRNVGESFYIRAKRLKCTIDKIKIYDDFKWIKKVDRKRFFIPETRDILMSRMDKDGCIKSGKESDKSERANICLVVLDITYECDAPYPVEFYSGPLVDYFTKKDDKMIMENLDFYYIYESEDSDNEITVGYNPILNTDEFYDSTDETIPDLQRIGWKYYMRDGEKKSFTIAYPIPEELLDEAYFVFDPEEALAKEDCYNAVDMHLVKVK